MEKIKFVKTRNEAMWGYQLNDGRIIDRTNLRYDTPFNLETGEIYEGDNLQRTGKNGLPDDAPEGFTTLNNLNAQKLGHEVYCYDEYNINLGEQPQLNDKKIKEIIAEFEEAGHNVTKKAIMHNYCAWLDDFKSGYRDEKNGYHLFSPCGHNPFQLCLTTLHPLCEDWQTTYEA